MAAGKRRPARPLKTEIRLELTKSLADFRGARKRMSIWPSQRHGERLFHGAA